MYISFFKKFMILAFVSISYSFCISPATFGFEIDDAELKMIFQQIKFTPKPQRIEFRNSIEVTDGDLEIHFRDTKHLEKINESFLKIEAKHIFYILDSETKDSEELKPINGKITQGKFINIVADQALNLAGTISLLPYTMILPQGSNWSNLDMSGKGISTGLRSKDNAISLIDIVDHFNTKILEIRTYDALKLLENRKNDRMKNPENYPALDDLCNVFLGSLSDININQSDYICSSSPIVYISNTKDAIRPMMKDHPVFNKEAISFISQQHGSGIYSADPFYLTKGFKIKTSGELVLGGELEIPEYNISIKSNKNLWSIGASVHGYSLRIYSGAKLFMLQLSTIKPQGLPLPIWNQFLKFCANFYTDFYTEE